jgi:hypothetical protein
MTAVSVFIEQRMQRRLDSKGPSIDELRRGSFGLFFQTSFDFFDGSRDLTDPQNNYSAIAAQKMGCLLVGE